jgi:uncharacterized Zn finger protein
MIELYQCPLCGGAQLESYGFTGLNIILKCLSCGQTFRDSTSVEADPLQSERSTTKKAYVGGGADEFKKRGG